MRKPNSLRLVGKVVCLAKLQTSRKHGIFAPARAEVGKMRTVITVPFLIPIMALSTRRFLWGLCLCLCLACQRRNKDDIARKDASIDSLKRAMANLQIRKLELLLAYAHAKQGFNGNVLIASKGKILLKKSYGRANFQTKAALTPETAFPIAALTRGFTATAILQLAERGKLRLDDTLGKFYPKFPYKKVRIIDLLHQTSGVPDYLTHFYTPQNQPLTHAFKQNVVDWIVQEAPKQRFPAQRAFALSSTNYILLADIVEKVGELPFGQYLEENIFRPVKMRHTFLKSPQKPPNLPRATGYFADTTKLADESFVDYVYGDAGLWSTLDDLWAWERALTNSEILSAKAVEQFGITAVLSTKRFTYYSLGWHLEKGGKAQVLRGDWLGFRAQMWRVPSAEQVIILLNNNQNAYLPALAEGLYTILQGGKVNLPAQ